MVLEKSLNLILTNGQEPCALHHINSFPFGSVWHLLSLLSPKADTHFTVPWSNECLLCVFSLQFDPAPRRGEPHVTRRTPDYFL